MASTQEVAAVLNRADFDTTMVLVGKQTELLAAGLTRSRLEPGGRQGPNGEVRMDTPGGQAWNDIWMLGKERDSFQTIIPDIRLPPNQYWPLHWHDCWIAVILIEGRCLVGDWWMEPGDVLVSAAELEYGPLVAGPSGCQLFEVGAKAHLFAGGYASEYRDHPTLQGTGPFRFKPRSELNRRNEGRQTLPVGGVEGLIQGHLEPGAHWDLGDPDDSERCVVLCSAIAAGEQTGPCSYDDWRWILVRSGNARLGAHELAEDDVLVVEPGVKVPGLAVGSDGLELLEVARSARGLQRR